MSKGIYTYHVISADSQEVEGTVEITAPEAINISEAIVNPYCNISSNGAINADVTGGVAPYEYSWNTGDSTNAIADLNEGTYILSVMDANGCTASKSFTLSNTLNLNIVEEISQPGCSGNGGSISVVVAKSNSKRKECTTKLTALIASELDQKLDTNEPWTDFAIRLVQNREQFWKMLNFYKENKATVCALGASTKGNVTLQTWEVTPNDITVIGDVNPDKDGSYTPGTWIPIATEDKVMEQEYDLYIVLPWHFKQFFVKHPKFKGKRLLFPLPQPEVVIP